MIQINLFYKTETDSQNEREGTHGCWSEGWGEGQLGSLGSVDANYYI